MIPNGFSFAIGEDGLPRGACEVVDAQDLWVGGVLLDLPDDAGGICGVAVRVDVSCEE